MKATVMLVLENKELVTIFEESPIGMAVVSLDHVWTRVNKAFCDITGYSKKELSKMTSIQMTHPADRRASAGFARRAMSGEIDSYRIDKRYKTKQGEYVWCSLSVALIRDKRNNPRYFVSQTLNIDERKRLESNLYDAKEKYSMILDATCDGFWDRPDIEKDEEFWSPRCKALLGYKPHEIKAGAEVFLNLIHPDDLERRNKHFEEHIQGKIPYDIDYRLKLKSGEYRWFNSKCKIFTDPNTGKQRKIGTITDVHEKKMAKEALAEKTQIFESMFKDSAVGMCVLSLDGKFLKANKKVIKILGYSAEELYSKRFTELLHKDDLEKGVEKLKLLQQGKIESYTEERRYIHKDGHIVYALLSVSLARDSFGNPQYWVTQAQDITEMKVWESRLSESKERYDLALKGSNIGIFDYDIKNGKYYWSDSLYRMLGLSRMPIESSEVTLKYIHPDDLEVRRKAKKALFEKDKQFDIQFRLKHNKGHYIWVRVKAKVVRDGRGNVIRMNGSTEDVTAKKELEIRLDERNQVFENIFKYSDIGMLTTDPTGKFQRVNKTMCKIVGYTEKELRQRCFIDITHEDDVAESRRKIKLMVEGKVQSYHSEKRYIHKEGHEVWALLSATSVRDESGKVLYLMAQVQDISAIKATQQALMNSKERFDLAIKGSNIGIFDYDLEEKDFYWSDSLYKIARTKKSQVRSMNDVETLIHPEDRERRREAIKDLIELDIPLDIEFRLKTRKDHYIWLRARGKAIRDSNGVAVRIAGSTEDVTTKKTMELKIVGQNKFFELVFTRSPVGMLIVSTEGNMLKVNKNMCNMVGYSEKELMKLAFKDITHPEDVSHGVKHLKLMMSGEIDSFHTEKRYIHKKGHIVWGMLYTTLVRDEDDKPMYFISQVTNISHRKKAEEDLRHLRDRYDLAVKGSGAGLWYWEFDSNYLFVAPRMHEILGSNQKTFPPHFDEFAKRLHKDDYDYVMKAIDDNIKKGREYDVEYRIKHDKGHYVWMRARGKVEKNEQGIPCRMAGAVENITLRKKAEAELKEVNEKYQLIVEASADGIWLWPDTSLDEQYWSKMLIDALGYKASELKPSLSGFVSILHPEDTEKVNIQSDPKMVDKPVEVEFRCRTKSGEYIYLLAKSILKRNKDTGIYSIYGTVADINDKKISEKALIEANERFNMAVSGSRDGIWDWKCSENKEVLYWSPQMFKIMGYRDSEFPPTYDHFMNILIHPNDQKIILDLIEDNRGAKDTTFDVEFRLRTKMGNYEWFQAKGIVDEYSNENFWRASGSLTNIHRRKISEQQIIEYTKELERINDDLDNFAYIASHDLKEPIRGLNTNALFLREDYGDKLGSDGLKRLERIMSLCVRMEKLVDDLLHFARLKNQELYIKKIDLNEVIEDIKDTIDITLNEQNAEIVVKQPLPKYVCDKIIVTELFRNLITNGIKYNNSKVKIIEIGHSIEVLNQDSGLPQYVFYVKDNGVGIQKRHYKDIFKVFKRLHDDDEFTRGTGVGLTFVKKIVERHGGRIWLESQPGKGSAFYFTLSSRDPEDLLQVH